LKTNEGRPLPGELRYTDGRQQLAWLSKTR